VSDRRGIDGDRPGTAEDLRAGMQGRTRREHIIDDHVTPGRIDLLAGFKRERLGDVLSAGRSVESRLRSGLRIFSQEELNFTSRQTLAEGLGDAFRLIIASIPLASGVERNGDENRAAEMSLKILIFQGRID
jgi:hypothetical protein